MESKLIDLIFAQIESITLRSSTTDHWIYAHSILSHRRVMLVTTDSNAPNHDSTKTKTHRIRFPCNFRAISAAENATNAVFSTFYSCIWYWSRFFSSSPSSTTKKCKRKIMNEKSQISKHFIILICVCTVVGRSGAMFACTQTQTIGFGTYTVSKHRFEEEEKKNNTYSSIEWQQKYQSSHHSATTTISMNRLFHRSNRFLQFRACFHLEFCRLNFWYTRNLIENPPNDISNTNKQTNKKKN